MNHFLRSAILCLSVVIPATTLASTDVSVGYGAIPSVNFISGYRAGYDFRHTWGTFNIGVEQTVFTPRLMVGINYSLTSAPSIHASSASQGRDVKATWHSLLASARYNYYTDTRMSVYGRIGIGVTIGYLTPDWEDSYNITRFGFQFSPIGIDYRIVGSLSGYLEGGLGVQGIVQLGLRLKL